VSVRLPVSEIWLASTRERRTFLLPIAFQFHSIFLLPHLELTDFHETIVKVLDVPSMCVRNSIQIGLAVSKIRSSYRFAGSNSLRAARWRRSWIRTGKSEFGKSPCPFYPLLIHLILTWWMGFDRIEWTYTRCDFELMYLLIYLPDGAFVPSFGCRSMAIDIGEIDNFPEKLLKHISISSRCDFKLF
jgi:hypothetical protein